MEIDSGLEGGNRSESTVVPSPNRIAGICSISSWRQSELLLLREVEAILGEAVRVTRASNQKQRQPQLGTELLERPT